MILIGLGTIFSLSSDNPNAFVGKWIEILTILFGWGGYIFPIGVIILGLWLILRDFESLPHISIERSVGLGLIFVFLLTCFHFALFPDDKSSVFELAKEGRGGGYIGGGTFYLLHRALGFVGTAVVLIAWFLISLAVTLDRSVLSLFSWISPMILRIQDMWDEYQVDRAAQKKSNLIPQRQPPNFLSEGQDISRDPSTTQASQPTTDIWNTGVQQEWVLPKFEEILDAGSVIPVDDEYDTHRSQVIEETLASFGAPGQVVEINRGPTITQFGVEPAFIETRGRRTRDRHRRLE